MVNSKNISIKKVASHYDELDKFYREVWGNHVHHGLWQGGNESKEEATLALIQFMTDKVSLTPQSKVCDIGCGYGETSRFLAAQFGCEVQAFTISKKQYDFAIAQKQPHPEPKYFLQDWMQNQVASNSIDFAFSIESSEHMPDFGRFFSEANRVLKPGGTLAIFAWLEPEKTTTWKEKALLQPLCDEGRMRLAKLSEYNSELAANNFVPISSFDLSDAVSRTWTICIQQVIKNLLSKKSYREFVFSKQNQNREFAKTLFRIRAAYAIGAMKYGLMIATKKSPNPSGTL